MSPSPYIFSEYCLIPALAPAVQTSTGLDQAVEKYVLGEEDLYS